jgi:uncharacterized protein YdaU (DUF1376 family)
LSKPPAFQLYAADFYMDTLTWEAEDIGVYFCLLMAEWVNGPLPTDPSKLAKIAKKTVQKFNKNFSKISHKFYLTAEGFYVNLRLEDERRKLAQFTETQSEKGKYGAKVRWEKEKAGALPVPLPEPLPALQPEDSSSSSTSYNNKAIPIIECKQPVDNSTPPLEEKLITPIPKSRYHKKETTEKEKRELQNLIQLVVELYPFDRYKFNPLLWIQNHISEHPQAIRTAFQRLIEANEKQEKIVNVRAYADRVVKEETKTLNAGDVITEAQEYKAPPTQKGMAVIGQIFQGMGRANP